VRERELALFDLHRGEAPPVSLAETLAGDGLVRIIAEQEHAMMARHAALREQAAGLEGERHELRTRVIWPWRLSWRRQRVQEMGARLREWHAEARELRGDLHALGLARERPEQYAQLSDGRHAGLTAEAMDALYAWAYSDACDGLIQPEAVHADAGACVRAYARMVDHWRVRYPTPVLATTAALLCAAPPERRATVVDHGIAVFDDWRRRFRTCPADRILVAASIALACRPDDDPVDVTARAESYQEGLREFGFPRERETLWAGTLLMLHGFPTTRLDRVHELWRRLVATGWSMSSATYPYAARLALVPGRAVEAAIRVERIYREIAERVVAEGRGKAVAASIMAHSDLYPTARHASARLMEARSIYADMVDRLLALIGRLPEPTNNAAWGDSRPAAAAILALMPGSLEGVWEAFATTLAALHEAAGPDVPRAGPGGADPLTGAALLLCDRAWGGRVSNRIFAFEACASCCPESWDELTMFRVSTPGWRM